MTPTKNSCFKNLSCRFAVSRRYAQARWRSSFSRLLSELLRWLRGQQPKVGFKHAPKPTSYLLTTPAFAQFAEQYNLITEASSEELAPLIDTTSHGAQLLLIHFLLIEFAIGEITLGPAGWRFGFRRRSCLAWLDRLLGNLPENYLIHTEWPLKQAATMLPHLTSPFHLPHIYSALGTQSTISEVYLPPV